MATQTFNFTLSPNGNLSGYMREIQKFPMLSHEEEMELACRWKEDADRESADKLVTSHLRLVAKIASGYKGYGLPIGELIAEGNVGLMQSVKGFDADRGFRFSTYAIWWIRAAVQEYILRSWSLVKMGTTASQKKLFFNLNRLKNQISTVMEGDLQNEHVSIIAKRLSVAESDVVNMNRRMTGHDHSLNMTMGDDSDTEWQDRLEDQESDQEENLGAEEELAQRRNLLKHAMTSLDQRELAILTERRLKDKRSKLEELAKVHGISRERVRQIEMRAFAKVQKFVKNQIIVQRIAA
jgi:RNA polymerase sigma-32 factor